MVICWAWLIALAKGDKGVVGLGGYQLVMICFITIGQGGWWIAGGLFIIWLRECLEIVVLIIYFKTK